VVVDKRVSRGATRTSVAVLDEAGRVEELARMLGGERVTETSRRHARELLRAARAAD
jgi:DNA repair protein RecN (Recombination protein N)